MTYRISRKQKSRLSDRENAHDIIIHIYLYD